ncbi:MAG: T9SS type A sorting domain-containing protein [Bacteroidota bacterium]|nr:T9SS type A sorting domain-containing protein [Bacteroidota bacterium]
MMGSISLNLLKSKVTSEPPGIISSYLYGFRNGAYHIADTLRPGQGYWVKANQDGKIILNVNSTASLNQPVFCADQPSANPPGAPAIPKLVKPDSGATGTSIYQTFRWRPSEDAESYHLQISTNNCFTNLFFDYPTITDTLKQVSLSYGKKYFWRVNAYNGIVPSNWSNTWVFTTQSAPQPPNPCDPVASLSTLDNFTITDANGNSQSMYTRNAGRAVNLGISDFEAPPIPPKGLFNVRFQSNKFIETILPNQKIKRMPIVIKDAQYPINISWNIKWQNNTKYWLTRPGSGEDKVLLTGNGNLSIGGSQNDVLFVEAQAALPRPCEVYKMGEEVSEDSYTNIPTEYVLEQNHPNPFNPVTQINYSLPDAGYVTLKIYDVLGREVAVLVNEFKEAGYYEVEFDASSLSSGVYIYKLAAGNYTSVRKMLLAK